MPASSTLCGRPVGVAGPWVWQARGCGRPLGVAGPWVWGFHSTKSTSKPTHTHKQYNFRWFYLPDYLQVPFVKGQSVISPVQRSAPEGLSNSKQSVHNNQSSTINSSSSFAMAAQTLQRLTQTHSGFLAYPLPV